MDYPDCLHGPLSTFPICNSSLPFPLRAASFLSQLNASEKISRLYSSFNPLASPGIPRLGIPPLQWVNDALHGLTAGSNFVFRDGDVDFNSSTSFPSPINFGATFDDSLADRMGSAIAEEARAFTNAGRGGVDLWTPNISIRHPHNTPHSPLPPRCLHQPSSATDHLARLLALPLDLFRDPRWGRGQETPGEDAYQVGRYAYSFVQGMQGGEDPRYYKAVANCKHYAAYDLEQWKGYSRLSFNAVVSQQELVEYFLVPFERCVRDARAGSIMCSFNAINGYPACADGFLLQTVARELWGYGQMDDGWVVSDCDGIGTIVGTQHFVNTSQAAAVVALLAGTDLCCGTEYRDYLLPALREGQVQEADIDRSVLRMTSSLLRTGYWDDGSTQPYRQYNISHVNNAEHHDTAYRAAVQSLTLLKNDHHILPLNTTRTSTSTRPLTIAVIGVLATDTFYVQGNYRGKPPYVITLLDALQGEGAGVQVVYAYGADVDSQNVTGFKAAVEAARAADVTVYIGGLTEQQEKEGGDRETLVWPGVQQQLIQQLGQASPTPLIVLVMGGGQMDLTSEKASTQVGALLWLGYPSMFAGRAIADVLFGRFSPTGRLVSTSYPADYIALPMTDMSLRPNATTGNPGRTYQWYTGQPVFPFGFGLSYSSFSYHFTDTPAAVQRTEEWAKRSHAWAVQRGMADHSGAPFVSYVANVTNTGGVVSDTSVLLFLNSTVPDTPLQRLIGYTHVYALAAGETRVVYFDVQLASLMAVDAEGDRWLRPGQYRVFIGHAGYAEEEAMFEMAGEAELIQRWPRRPSEAPGGAGGEGRVKVVASE